MAGVMRFRKTDAPRQAGEQARLKVVHGPDQGSVFVLGSAKVSVGRGNESDLMLSDLKASRKHFELENRGDGSWALRDLGSANGVVIKGAPIRSALIRSGEILTLGETVLEFVTADAGTRIMVAPSRTLDQIRSDENALQAQRERVRALAGKKAGAPGPAQVQPAPEAKKKPNPMVLILIATVALIYMITSGDNPVSRRLKKKPPAATESATNRLSEDQFKIVKSQVDPILRIALREYNNGNLQRARQHFDEVLRLQPDHPVANRYLDYCRLELDRTALKYLERGKRLLESGKLKEAKSSFELARNTLIDVDPGSVQIEHANTFIERIAKIEDGKASIDDGDKLIGDVRTVLEKLNRAARGGKVIAAPSNAPRTPAAEGGGP